MNASTSVAEMLASSGDRSAALFDRARHVIPGGVNSPVRAFRGVGGTPRFIRSASGARMTDVDGRTYLDYVGSWGVMLLGHAPREVTDALREALESGTSYGAPAEGEVELAELLCEMVPGLEAVRMVNSGTEATMSAVRLARAVTRRPRIVKFRGGYHGHGDAFLVEAGSGAATLGVPSSPGINASTAADTLVAEYNDLAGVRDLFEHLGETIAGVVVEPVAGNMGCVPPIEGFLQGLRAICDEFGALLLFDEVMTGFRIGPRGAQGRYGVTADLIMLGKVIGGGLPVGAFGGRADLMRRIAPDGPVYQAGTFSGNPLTVIAGLSTLRLLQATPGIYEHLESLAEELRQGFTDIGHRLGMPLRWNGVVGMGSLFFTGDPVTGWQSVQASDSGRFPSFFHGMLERGIHLPPSAFESWFWSRSHTVEDIARTLETAEAVLRG